MGEEREFGDAIVEDAPLNAGEESFEVEDAGSDSAPVIPPEGKRWVDVALIMRFEVNGDADADMVASGVHGLIAHDLEATGGEVPQPIAEGTPFESTIKLLECVKTGGTEQGIQR